MISRNVDDRRSDLIAEISESGGHVPAVGKIADNDDHVAVNARHDESAVLDV